MGKGLAMLEVMALKDNLSQDFYGEVLGHFNIKELDPSYRGRGTAALQIEFYANPAGSRNLEFDPAKQIQPHQ